MGGDVRRTGLRPGAVPDALRARRRATVREPAAVSTVKGMWRSSSQAVYVALEAVWKSASLRGITGGG